MWININDDSIADLCNINNSLDKKALTINHILNCVLYEKHIVYLSVKSIENLLKLNYIDDSNKRLLKFIYDKHSFVYNAKTRVKHSINVSTKFKNITIEEDKDKFNYNVPLQYLFDIRETCLITENESDCKFYKNLFFIVNKLNDNNKCYGINLENNSCHGSNICSKINEVFDNKRIAICILDSDKDYYDDKNGATYRGAYKQYKKIKSKSTIRLFHLISREKENLIPPKVYLMFLDKSSLLEVLKQFENDDKIISFFDIKDGIKCKKYNENRFQDYYKTVIKILNDKKLILMPIDPKNNDYDDDKTCIEGIGDKADIIIDVLSNGINKIKNNKISKINKNKINRLIRNIKIFYNDYLPEYMKKEWNILYELLFDWGCCWNLNHELFDSLRNINVKNK